MSGIEELKGINKEKEGRFQDNFIALELKKKEQEFIKELRLENFEKVASKKNIDEFIEEFNVVNKRVDASLNGLGFLESDLQDYLLLRGDEEKAETDIIGEGLFSGFLLSSLTRRYEKEGKSTRFYFNGHGATFNGLFFMANYVDQVIIENFKGVVICGGIGGLKGKANGVIIKDCEGDAVGFNAGIYGNIELICITNCKGEDFGSYLGTRGKVDLAMICNCEGTEILSTAAEKKGSLNFVASIDNNTKEWGFDYLAKGGTSKTTYIKQSTGHLASLAKTCGQIERLILDSPKEFISSSPLNPKILNISKELYTTLDKIEYSEYFGSENENDAELSIKSFQSPEILEEWKYLQKMNRISQSIKDHKRDINEFSSELFELYKEMKQAGVFER